MVRSNDVDGAPPFSTACRVPHASLEGLLVDPTTATPLGENNASIHRLLFMVVIRKISRHGG
jgi:hypothetical protein